MSSVGEIPEPWAAAMVAAGLTDPRYARDVPSRSSLAKAASTTTSTISAMIAGTRDTDPRIVQRVAEALNLADRADEVARWVGDARTSPKPFRPHRDADLLTSEEQEAVNELIRLLALPKKRAGEVRELRAANQVPEADPADQSARDEPIAAAESDPLTGFPGQSDDDHA